MAEDINSDLENSPLIAPVTSVKPGSLLSIIIPSFITGAGLSVAILYGYQYYQLKQQNTLSSTLKPATPISSPVNQNISNSYGWKTFSTDDFSFQYPSLFIVEERVKNFFVIVEPQEQAAHAGVALDARTSDSVDVYESFIAEQKASLIDPKTEKRNGWIVISGKGAQEMTEGISFKSAYIYYNHKFYSLSTINLAPYNDLFDHILASFTFTTEE